LARQHSAELVLTHVVDDDLPPRLIDVECQVATALLNDLVQTLRENDGINCESRTALGDPFQGIVKVATDTGADILVLGPHRRQVLRDVFFGTTAERTIRTSGLPVLMANSVPVGSYRKLLIATDFSDSSLTAAQTTRHLGLFSEAEIIAIHVLDNVEGGPIIRAAMTAKEAEDKATMELDRALEQLSEFARKVGVVAECRAIRPIEQTTAMAINSYAKTTKTDLIVVGTHGRSGMEKWLLGSIAESVLRTAEIDVLAVPLSQKSAGLG
jgi:nucleotide-binding universal stress UspA family protein